MTVNPSYTEHFRKLADQLEARPGWRVRIWWSEVDKFACTGCGKSCTRDWRISVERGYTDRMAGPLQRITGLPYEQLFERWPGSSDSPDEPRYAVLTKKPGTTECIFYDQRGLCVIHDQLGPEAKPLTCQRYPHSDQRVNGPIYDNPALALSCTRAISMLREPQELLYQLIPGSGSNAQVLIAPGRHMSRSAWLVWLGLLLDGLEQSFDFHRWLGKVASALSWMLRQPGPELPVPDFDTLPAGSSQPMSPAESASLLQGLIQGVVRSQPGLRQTRPWLEAAVGDPAKLSLSPPEAWRLEQALVFYWQRQLLRPAALLRGELNLLQQMLFIGVQGMLFRLSVHYLRDGAPLLDKHLDQAANQIYAFVAQDHAMGPCRPWNGLRPEICLTQLLALSRWRQPIASGAIGTAEQGDA